MLGIPTASAVDEPPRHKFQERDESLPGAALEELDVLMLTSRSWCSNDVEICLGRASEAAASLSCRQNVAETKLTKVQSTFNGVKLWASNRDLQ